MFPKIRMRRLRRRNIRPLLCETTISKNQLIMPLFFEETENPQAIESMPGQFRWPVNQAGIVAERLYKIGIRAVLLFGIPQSKDSHASGATADDGIIQKAIRKIKETIPELVIITDVCACEYTDHGHCGFIGECLDGTDLLNDQSLELMQEIALSHAKAGADIVAPSSMLDGVCDAIREVLDNNGYSEVLIMAYSSKFASAMYAPFRDAADSGFTFGDRSTYQAPVTNRKEAHRESELDAAEGADILMVKPAGWFCDIISDICDLGLPVAAYQVSGEYSMIKAASLNGWLDEKKAVMESITCIKRAGAGLIITYFAEDICRWEQE